MKSYKLIGLTGATGAGKSEVAALFEQSGFAVVSADLLAREIMKNPLVPELLARCFGADILKNGELDRSLLAQKAFSSRENTALLNSVTHPFITELFLRELRRLSDAGQRKILFDAPQLFESGLDVLCDLTVAVTAPRDERLRRIRERDGLSGQDALRRIGVQFTDGFFAEKCDFVIENSSTLTALAARVGEIILRI